jgi:hypothetical protein
MSERTDTERLDWLDSLKPPGWEQVMFEYLDEEFAGINFCHDGYDDDCEYYTGDTWRQAIDAAMDAEENEG